MGPVPTLPLAELRARLQQRERRLRDELAPARDDAGRAGGEVQDRKDLAERAAAADVAEAEGRRDLDELREVAAALQRLDADRYGDCEDCGTPIGALRLLARPAARRCLACQAVHERRAPAPAG